jgi:glutamine amidotransferase
MIVIVDYNLGNVGSIYNMVRTITKDVKITSNDDEILSANKIILPGVGSFDNGMQNLKNLHLIEVLNEAVIDLKIPILGICLGMQLMTNSSEEGIENGLGWLPIDIIHFNSVKNFRGTIPVMGWNYVKPSKPNKLLINEGNRFYFVHSYHCKNNEFQIISSEIDGYEYCAAFQKNNVFGVQFHPEKSHKFGIQLLEKFCNL